MGRTKNLKPMYGLIKEMYLSGMEAKEIAKELGTTANSIFRILTIMGVPTRRTRVEKAIDIDEENLVYADNSFQKLEKVVIDGKRYVDITPIFSPR